MGRIKIRHLLLLKNILRYSICFLILSCNYDSPKVFTLNSKEYLQEIENFDVSLSMAINLASKRYFKEYPNAKEFKYTIHLIYNNNYIFSTESTFYNHKTAQYSLKGVWVNGKTQETKVEKGYKFVRHLLNLPFNENYYSEGVIKRY